MNDLATVGIVGAAVGMAKGVIDQKNAQKYDSQAGTNVGSYIKNGISNAIPLGLAAMGGYAGIGTLLGKEFTIKGTNVKDIAKSIAGNVYPGRDELIEELNETMVKNVSSSKKFLDKQAQSGANHALEKFGGLSEEEAKKITKSISSKNVNENIDALKDTISNTISEDRDIDKVLKGMKNYSNDAINKEPSMEDVISGMKKNEKYLHYPKAYFTNPDKTVRNTRKGVAIGTYAGLAIGGRYLQGGSLTRDEYGRRDIAGVPFL